MPILRLDDVPDWVVETLSRRATNIGMSLPDYTLLVLMKVAAADSPDERGRPAEEILAEIETDESAERPTAEEILALIREGRKE